MRKLLSIILFTFIAFTTSMAQEYSPKLLKKAQKGDATAQRVLGYCYQYGRGVKQDYAKAVEWYCKAAEQGDADVQLMAGIFYYSGLGVTKDYAKAVEWWRKAANQGNADGQSLLGYCYYLGLGVPKDYSKAVEWCRKAAQQGDASAKHNQSVICYEQGNQQYKEENFSDAFTNLKLAAEDKNNPIPQAMTLLAGCYEYGYGTTVDLDNARHWREEAAKYNDENAKKALEILSPF
jgi:TPR repeat protein